MKITRRQFNQTAMSLGLAWAGGRWLTGCGDSNSGSSGNSTSPQTETKTFHFDLSASPPADAYVLHVGGRRYGLQRHTATTRASARHTRPGLKNVPDNHLTHYVDGVVMSTRRQQRLFVTTFNTVRSHGVALVAMNIPSAARIKARRARGLVGAPMSSLTDTDCAIADQVEDDFLTARSTAKAMITHYPDVMNLDPDVAAQVETLMDCSDCGGAAAVDNLTLSICSQGPAYEHDPMYYDGWAVLVLRLDADGNPILDSKGDPTYDYVFSDQTNQDLPAAAATIVNLIRNDSSLKDQQYQVLYHGDPIDTDSLPAANTTPLLINQGMPATAGPKASTGTNISASTTGYHHNVLFYDLTTNTAVNREFSLKILNLNYIWYGLYLEYLDADGVPIPASGSGVLDALVADVDLETDTLKFWDVVSSPATIFGIPIPFPYLIDLTIPDGAAQVRINLIGPGGHGNLPYGPSVIVGAVLTGLIQYVIPSYFLASGLGIDETATLEDLILKTPGVLFKTILSGYQLIAAALGINTNQLGFQGSVISILSTVTENIIKIPLQESAPELDAWIDTVFTTEEVEDSIPFIGWVLRATAVAGTIGQMLTSNFEIALNPVNITNTISLTNSVTVVIHHDPSDFEFPLDATHFQVQITPGTTALEPPLVMALGDAERSNDTLTVVIDNVPSTGANATVTVIFFAANGYPLAHSAATDSSGAPVFDENGNRVPGDVTFFNKVPNNGQITVQVALVENPVPINAQTQYTHHQKLEYANGKYLWNYTLTPPALEAPSCGASGLCDLGNVTVWVPGGMIGYSWLANSPAIKDCVTGAQGQLYNFQNISLKNDPNPPRKAPGCGFSGATPITYDETVPVGNNGYNFYLDPVRISDSDPEYHLRRITLDNTTTVIVNTNESWGRFRIPIDRMAVYSKGSTPRVAGISTRFHKLAILDVPTTPYIGDDFANNARVMSGKGEGNDGLMLSPLALTIADNGAVLVLQGGTSMSLKAFDLDGKPWKFFNQGTSSVLPLPQDDPQITWLDISIDPTNLIYVLSHVGTGTNRSDYRLDVYDASDARHVVRNTGIAVGRIVVDKFRGLYSLNYETVKGSPIVEPSVSVWAPSPPQP